jgi:hypothetical protein
MSERINVDELYELRGLLAKLREEPGLREHVETYINGVHTLTSVLLDLRREERVA